MLWLGFTLTFPWLVRFASGALYLVPPFKNWFQVRVIPDQNKQNHTIPDKQYHGPGHLELQNVTFFKKQNHVFSRQESRHQLKGKLSKPIQSQGLLKKVTIREKRHVLLSRFS